MIAQSDRLKKQQVNGVDRDSGYLIDLDESDLLAVTPQHARRVAQLAAMLEDQPTELSNGKIPHIARPRVAKADGVPAGISALAQVGHGVVDEAA